MEKSANLINQGGLKRKTLVEEEKWVPLGDWYLGPGGDKSLRPWEWRLIIAHQCEDGSIRAPLGFFIYKRKRTGTYNIGGKCPKCGKKLSEELKFMMRMMMLDI